MTAIEEVLWPGLHALEPKSQLGGIYANKPGYHNKRANLPSSDYSVAQFSVDRVGPADEASAIDWTFPDAQGGNYSTISKYSKRLYAARLNNDPRTVYMREFFGQIDSDKTVEGWDYTKDRASSSDSSHLWHIHISIHRKYINSVIAMRAILSILKGETVAQWQSTGRRSITWQEFKATLPELKRGDSDPIRSSGTASFVARAQRGLNTSGDGEYGPDTAARVKALGTGSNGNVIRIEEYRPMYGIFSAEETGRMNAQGRERVIDWFTFTAQLPVLKQGDSDDNGGITGRGVSYVSRAQRALGVEPDGDYGPDTAAAVKRLGLNDGKTIDLEIYAQVYGIWGYEITKEYVANYKK